MLRIMGLCALVLIAYLIVMEIRKYMKVEDKYESIEEAEDHLEDVLIEKEASRIRKEASKHYEEL